MSRAYPYRRPPEDVVTVGPWLRLRNEVPSELPYELSDWDYESVLHLRRQLRIDGRRARLLSGLSADAALDLSVVWSSTSSALRGRVWQEPVPATDEFDVEIRFDLPGGELGGRLDLEVLLTLRTPGPSTMLMSAPRRPGSVLWRDVVSVLLQGDAVLFPLAVVDFDQLPYPTGASWHLELSRDLDAQALGSILLLANKRREPVTAALQNAADPADADRRVLSTIRTDVTRSLIETALMDDEFDLDAEYPLGSVGALLVAVVRATFPDRSLEELRLDRRHFPVLFTTRVQHATDLLAGP